MATNKGHIRRFKGQREKEALIQGLLLSFREHMRVEKPSFEEFVRLCETRLSREREARELAAKRWMNTLRWGLGLASVLILGLLVGGGLRSLRRGEDMVAKQTGKVDVETGSRLHVSHYRLDTVEVIHFVLSSGEATFYPDKLPPSLRYIVETPTLYIRVVGTVFRVRVVSNETTIRVEEGKVWCYPRSEGFTLDQVIGGETPPRSRLVLAAGESSTWGQTPSPALPKPRVPSPSPSRPSAVVDQGHPSSSPQTGSLLFSIENTTYRVRLLRDGTLDILSREGKTVSLSLASWAREWFSPVLLEDSVVVVSRTGIIVRFRYDGKLIFKMRPVDGKLLGQPLVTTRGVILMQSRGLTLCLWDGSSWTIPADSDFLARSRPYYDPVRDILVYANEPGSLAGYSLSRKDILWTHRFVREFVAAPIVGSGEIAYVYGGNANILLAVNTHDGHFVWSTSLETSLITMEKVGSTLGVILSSPTGSQLQVFSLREGDTLLSLSIPGRIMDTLADNENWYLLTTDKEIYRFNPQEKRLHFLTRVEDATRLTFSAQGIAVMRPSSVMALEK